MHKRDIKYKDFDGNEVTDTFYFGLNEVEITNMETEHGSGLEVFLKHLVETKDAKRINELFQRIILMSYGEKSEDGKRFVKNEELSTAFSQTAAFPALYISMLQDTNTAVDFFKGIVPVHMQQMVTEAAEGQNVQFPVAPATTSAAAPPVPPAEWTLPPQAQTPPTPPPPPPTH